MPPTAFQESQRTYEQIEKAAKDTLDKICEFDIKLCPWEVLLSKYCVLNKNLETIQSMIKKDDSNFRMALLYPKDENVDNLVRITNILSVYTHDLQKTKDTKELPQITSQNQLAYAFSNPSEQIEKRTMHDDIVSTCSSYIVSNYKQQITANKKVTAQQRFKLLDAKELLHPEQQKNDVSIRKQSKMRTNTILQSMKNGTKLTVQNEEKSDIAHLKEAERRSFVILNVSKKPNQKEEPFKVNLPILTAANNNTQPQQPTPQQQQQSGKLKISTVHNQSIPVKKEETPGQDSKRTPVQKKSTPGSVTRQTVKKSAPSPTVNKTPSPSTTSSNPSFVPPQGITPPITPQSTIAANSRARQTPQSTTPKNIQSRPPPMVVNNMGATASPTPGSARQASPNMPNQIFNMPPQSMMNLRTPPGFQMSPMGFPNMQRGTPSPHNYPPGAVRLNGTPTGFNPGHPSYFLNNYLPQQPNVVQQQPPPQQKK